VSASAAVVITTYNNPRVLGICLKSFSNQTSSDFDIFVADDGSTDETKAKIEALRRFIGRPIKHFWHPDQGYKKAKINNEVFRHLDGYRTIICVDHDTIAGERFVEDHLAAHARDSRAVFMGRRVELGPKLSSQLTEENVLQFNRRPGLELAWSGLTGDTRGWLRGFRIGSARLRSLFGRDNVPDLLGSNFSVSRELLLEVNGYDEDYEAYWGEDGDLFIRLRNTGAKLAGSKSLAIQFHLDHPRLEPKPEHQARYEKALGDREYRRCRNGIVRETAPVAAR
jgi:GT2 family glycosyltransferase